jgi:hypothetical protein
MGRTTLRPQPPRQRLASFVNKLPGAHLPLQRLRPHRACRVRVRVRVGVARVGMCVGAGVGAAAVLAQRLRHVEGPAALATHVGTFWAPGKRPREHGKQQVH